MLILFCGDVLLLMKNEKCIKCIFNGKLVIIYVKINNVNEFYYGVGLIGEQVYVCILYDLNKCKWGNEKIFFLDEFGRILMFFCLLEYCYLICCLIFCFDERNKFFRIFEKIV